MVSCLFTFSHFTFLQLAPEELLTLKKLKANMFRIEIQNFLDEQLLVYFQLIDYFSQQAPQGISNTKKAQSKDVGNEKSEFLIWSAVCLLSVVCLIFPTSSFSRQAPQGTSNAEKAQSKYVWNENYEFHRWAAICLLFSNKPIRGF